MLTVYMYIPLCTGSELCSLYTCISHCAQGLSYAGKAVHLRGHDGPINCMVACKPFSIVVTGSADRTCILWDTNR